MRAYLIAVVMLVFTAWLSLHVGAVDGLDWAMARELRLPRMLAAIAVGMGLAVAGAALQALFGNPLAEPYTLGISSGAALGAVIGISLGIDDWGWGVGISAFMGAALFGVVLLLVSLKRGAGNLTLLLVGVMLGFFGSSLVALWMALADPQGVYAAVYWLMGDLARVRQLPAIIALVMSLALSFAVWTRWPVLDALITGEESARSLGFSTTNARRFLLFAVSLLVGLCVSVAGMIGFVGLLVPHVIRLSFGTLHRKLLPLCALWGAVLLLLADVVARRVASPQEIPVGVVTALIGAPAFLVLLLRNGAAKR